MKVPILAYRPLQMAGMDYAANPLAALAADLERIAARGFTVLPLADIVEAWLANRGTALDGRVVALTTEVAADFDFHDLPHPTLGVQRSVLNILRDFAARHPASPPHVTSFVVASPAARAHLDAACMVGAGWWRDDWWPEAVRSGLMHLGSNGWDHNHEALPESLALVRRRGTFDSINTARLADLEIRQAVEFLRARAPNPGDALFAYPYGGANHFLTHAYFPAEWPRLGVRAAFTGRAGFLEPGTSRWEVPRFLHGRDWRSPEALEALLDEAADRTRAWVPAPPRVDAPVTSAAAADSMGAFETFLAERVDRIPGWLLTEAALLTRHLTATQRELGLGGPVLEIGVYQGRYLSVLYALAAPDEKLVGFDLFVGADAPEGTARRARENVAAACGDASRLELHVANSLDLTPERLRVALGAPARFVSVDGGHTQEVVANDLALAQSQLARGGIIALDDAFNFSTPGVCEGIARYFLAADRPLAPFAMCANKLFVTTPDFHARYLQATVRFLEQSANLPTAALTLERRAQDAESRFTPTLYGYEIAYLL